MRRPRWVWRTSHYWCGNLCSPWVRLKWWLTHRFIDSPSKANMKRCWARVCDWGLGFAGLSQMLNDSEGNERCQDEARSLGVCYCCRFACRETLVDEGCDPSAIHPDRWVESTP